MPNGFAFACTTLFVVLVALPSLGQQQRRPQPQPQRPVPPLGNLTPGLHHALPTSDPDGNYDLYLSAAYAPQGRPLPVVVLLGDTEPKTLAWAQEHFFDWAERRGVIVMIPDSGAIATRLATHPDPAVFNEFETIVYRPFNTALKQIPGADAVVRVAVGTTDGSGSHGALWACRFPASLAGLAFEGRLGDRMPPDRVPAYLAVYEMVMTRRSFAAGPHGPKVVHSFLYDQQFEAETQRQWGSILHLPNSPSTVIGNATYQDRLSGPAAAGAAAYLIDAVRLTHPRVPAADRAATLDDVKRRLADALNERRPAEWFDALDALSRLPGLDAATSKAAVEAWRAAAVAVVDSEPDPFSEYERLGELTSDPRMSQHCPEWLALRRRADALWGKSSIRAEVAAHEAVQKILLLDTPAVRDDYPGHRPSAAGGEIWASARTVPLLQEVIRRYPDTFGADEARRRINKIQKTK